MVKIKARYRYIIWGAAFLLYALFAARPVPKETVFVSKWLKSLSSNFAGEDAGKDFIPFELSGRFGYVSPEGDFSINTEKQGYVELSPEFFAEFSGEAEKIPVRDVRNQTMFTIENKHGYPFFLDNRIFILHSDQNSISEIDTDNNTLWTYDFASPLTCADSGGGLLLVGGLDGSVALLDNKGKLVYSTEPSGSRIPAIYGCAITRDGTKAAVISGLDHQRFLVMEYEGQAWRITHHEFLAEGFRRPVHIKFLNNDKIVVYERQDGIGVYNVLRRSSQVVPIEGTINRLDSTGENDLFFLVMSESAMQKKLVAVRYPNRIIISAPFTSAATFFNRRGNLLFIGGGNKLAAFQIEEM